MREPDRVRAELTEKAARLPGGPGVYRWRDATGRVLYVGKAADLKARVRTYLRGGEG
ncbi:MAG TPA: GIY-YIG nuclease family protein, partial [Vicinamibacteria bacterium]